MWPGVRTKMGVMLMARSREAKSALPSTQLISEERKASLKGRTRCENITLLERLVLLILL